MDINEILIEEEKETIQDMEFVPDRFSQAVIWGTDWTTETINNQLVKGNIDLNPSFQRRDAWDNGEKSRLIESLMLGLPVPPIILAENKGKKNSYIVIDGKQRLLSIRRFFTESQKDKEKGSETESFKPLRLSQLEILKDIENFTLEKVREEKPEYLCNLENQPIRTIVIRNWPDEPFLYTVFLRLNTGSKKLSSQELRQALKPGPFLDYLDQVTAESTAIMRALNNKKAYTRMKDVELTLRFFAFRYYFSEYNGNLKVFLDDACDKFNQNWSEIKDQIGEDFRNFENTITFSFDLMSTNSPFSRYHAGESIKKFNMSVFELFSFYFSFEGIRELVKNNREMFISAFISLNDDSDFVKATSGTTHDVNNVTQRFYKFSEILISLPGANEVKIPLIKLNNGKVIVSDNLTV